MILNNLFLDITDFYYTHPLYASHLQITSPPPHHKRKIYKRIARFDLATMGLRRWIKPPRLVYPDAVLP